jgi:hypothetical protein
LRRVLRPDGLLIISTPNRPEYSDRRNFHNEFHVRELDASEFNALIGRYFRNQRWFGQKLLFNSGVWPLADPKYPHPEWLTLEDVAQRMPVPMYFIAIASQRPIPESAPVTLFADPDETIYREFEQTVSRVRALESLTRERDAQLNARAAEIAHLETLSSERERIVEERDRQLEAQAARAELMEKVIGERDETLEDRNRQLDMVGARATRLEELVVQRDAELAALNARVDRIEKLVDERDSQLAAVNARIMDAEQLIAHRERLVVERDRLLEQTNERAATLETFLMDRERIIVERDGQLATLASRAAELKCDLDSERSRVAALETEVERRGGLRWWLALPLLRLRRAFNLKPPAPGQQRQA